jgi:hypothetical protein
MKRTIVRRSFEAMLLGLAFLPALPAWSHSGDVLRGFGTATVDGIISDGEYGDSCIGPLSQTAGSITYTFTICETNDEENDYYAVMIDDLTKDSDGDALVIFFDNKHDGKVTPGGEACAPFPSPVEDMIGFLFDSYTDSFYCYVPPFSFGFLDTASVDGTGVRTFTPGVGWVYEFSRPLNSGDPDDYSLAIGDTVGWCLTYDDGSNPGSLAFGNSVQFPPGCYLDAVKGSTKKYGDVEKISALQGALDELMKRLKALVATCQFCPPDPQESLLDKINEALKQVHRGHDRPAANALKQFIRRTERFVRSGQVLAEEGQRFIELAEEIIADLSTEALPSSSE